MGLQVGTRTSWKEQSGLSVRLRAAGSNKCGDGHQEGSLSNEELDGFRRSPRAGPKKEARDGDVPEQESEETATSCAPQLEWGLRRSAG